MKTTAITTVLVAASLAAAACGGANNTSSSAAGAPSTTTVTALSAAAVDRPNDPIDDLVAVFGAAFVAGSAEQPIGLANAEPQSVRRHSAQRAATQPNERPN